ncbi:MAG: hypothetical protein GC151_18915 [Betaproteobacteria bacterium]|nr:hypothetical protein [Betaproteobacteria bacterium]
MPFGNPRRGDRALAWLTRRSAALARIAVTALALLATAVVATGCAEAPTFVSSPPPGPDAELDLTNPVLGPGDMLEISFLPTAKTLSGPYRIDPEDRLRVDVANHTELSRDSLLVLPDGSISLPELGRIMASGKTVVELSAAIRAGYEARFIRAPSVVVSVEDSDVRLKSLITRRPEAMSVEPSVYRVSENGTIDLPYIAQIQANRRLRTVRDEVIRAYQDKFAGRLEVTVNLRQARPQVVYVIGEVPRPGTVDFRYPFNPLMAISSAGGFLPTAAPANVVLFRFGTGGTHSQWMMNFRTPMEGKGGEFSPIAVLPGDVIFVPKSGIALSNALVEQYVRNMIPIPFGFGITVPVK